MSDLLGENELFAFEFFNLAFVSADNGLALRFHDAVEQLSDLLLGKAGVALHRGGGFMDFGLRFAKALAEKLREQAEQLNARHELAEHRLERAFHCLAPDGFAEHHAAAMTADVIGISAVAPFGPVSRHRVVAFAAGHETTQRKILVNVCANRREGLACKSLLHLMEGRKRYDRFVLAGTQRNVPFLALDIARVDRARHDPVGLLVRQKAVSAARKLRMGLKEALHFRF